MRAMQLQACSTIEAGRDPLVAVDIERPTAAPGQVVLRVHVCAVCHTELDQIEGRVATSLPRVPGHQAVGTVVALGDGVDPALQDQRVGVGWIASSCGRCRWCARGEENLCREFRATGRDLDGGYAEYMAVDAGFVHPVPDALPDAVAAPMLCAGAIGYRSLKLAELPDGGTLGLTGFGASNHLVLKLARILHPARTLLVWARNPDQREQARSLGADWAGDTHEHPPVLPDAIIDTTPVWTTVLAALKFLAPGGRLVINAIAKESSDRARLAELDYPSQLWREKEIKSVANVTRADIAGFLELAASRSELQPEHTMLALERANEALRRVRQGGVRGAFVLAINDN